MNLAQYRLKAAAQNRNRLWLCLAAAGMLHVGATFAVSAKQHALTHPLSHHTSPDLIQFILIDQPDSPPTASSIRANSTSRSVQMPRRAISTVTGITRSLSSVAASQSKMPLQAISAATAKDEVWGAYLTTLRQRIYQQWQATPLVSDRPAKVRFVIDRQGHLTNLELIQSSSDATVDRGAIKAIQAAAPFAQLPIASKEDQLRVTFTFEAPFFLNNP